MQRVCCTHGPTDKWKGGDSGISQAAARISSTLAGSLPGTARRARVVHRRRASTHPRHSALPGSRGPRRYVWSLGANSGPAQ